MAAFSRLQLAAALIEYDNDDLDPDKPRKSAHESAIFAPLRRNLGARGPASRKSTDYLGVSIPSAETGSIGGRDSVAETRRSRGSSDALRNPFGRDSTYEGLLEEDEEEEMEVDLASWGLDALVPKEPKEKGTKSSRKKEKSAALPNPHRPSSSFSSPALPSDLGPKKFTSSRSMSLGGLDSFGEGGAFLDAQSSLQSAAGRRHSFGSPLDLPEIRSPQPLPHGRRPSTHALIENLPVTPPLHSVPFPSGSSARSISPLPQPGTSQMPSQRPSFDAGRHGRTYSSASLGSKALFDQDVNQFSVRPPSPERASQFDPKISHARTLSNNTLGTMALMPEESNPFSVRPPSPSRSSRFDPKAIRARTVSNYSIGTQMMLDDDVSVNEERRERPRLYSRSELMRPKVLIMPSPLQGSTPAPAPSIETTRDGFLVTTDGPPLPAAARSGNRRSISAMSLLDPSSPSPIASNSFTPNPRMSLSLSQLTFRNTLAVDGQRDVAYSDLDNMRRATEDGEQIVPDPIPEVREPTPPPPVIDDSKSKRPAGKLYGKSLIDDLENRKAEMRGKQRVFTGDQRPSMMARSTMKRSSTLIDPESLKQRPQSQRMSSYQSQPDLVRRNSANIKPLLDFDEGIPGAPHHLGADPLVSGTTRSRSVFGVDTLWEREMAKLKQMEEQEKAEAEERKKREAEEDAKRRRKGKGKKKKAREASSPGEGVEGGAEAVQMSPEPRASSATPPVLPMIQRATVRRAPPPPGDDDDESEEDSDSSDVIVPSGSKNAPTEGWFAGASDDEEGPVRTTGSGPRYPRKASVSNSLTNSRIMSRSNDRRDDKGDDSSEEDLPLVATIGRAAERMSRMDLRAEDDSDEEKPLSVLLDKTKLKLPSSAGSIAKFDLLSPAADDDDDDKPLGLTAPRASQAFSTMGPEDEDDKPLALHPEQLRKSQYFFAQQQQQQQQQQMMYAQAAQLHQSMIFGAPSMMGSGFFGPPMAPPMMIPPQIPGTPPPLQDTAKFGRIDHWRRDVAVEGER